MSKLRDWMVLGVGTAVLTASLTLLQKVVGFASPWFALVLMFDFLGVVALAQPLYLLKLPGFLRRQREWETDGRLYEALGVPTFGALLRRTPLRYLNPLVYLKQCRDPSVLQAHIESAEAAHVLASLLLAPYIVYACVHVQWSALAWVMLVQTSFNFYPIMHLRWSRVRINRLRDRIFSGHGGAT